MIINSDNGRRVFVLEIAGLKYRYMSHNLSLSASNLEQNITTGIPFINVMGLISVGALSGSIDPAGGVASYQGVSVTLASRGARGAITDPHVVFGRCGARSEIIKAKLTQDIAYDDSPTLLIRVDRDLRGTFSTPAVVHIGAESFRVSSITATSLICGVRAVGGSQRQGHLITMGGTNVPEISTEITTFRGRRASLYMAHQFPDGSLSDFVEAVNGFIDNTPAVEEAEEISFSILPLAALASTVSSAMSAQSYLKQGFHYFGTIANRAEWAWRLVGQNNRMNIKAVDSSSAPIIVLTIDTEPELVELFDVTLPTASDGFERCHPRFPALYILNGQEFIEPSSVTATQITYDATNQPLLNVGDYLRLEPSPEIKRVSFSEQIVEWPAALNSQLGLLQAARSVDGTDGSWGRWSLAESEAVITPNAATQPYRLEFLSWTSRQALLNEFADAKYWGAVPSGPLRDDERLRYPLQFGDTPRADPRPGTTQTLTHLAPALNGRLSSSRFTLGGVARAWYQLREPLILCENGLGLPSAPDGNLYDVEVKYYDRVAGEVRRQWFIATHETTAIYSGDAVGVYVHLAPGSSVADNASFGDWQGQERAILFRSTRYNNKRPGELLLNILESGGGSAVNGAYDVFPVGLSIASSDIDEASFIAYDSTAGFCLSGTLSGDDADIQGALNGVLKLMGCALIMSRSSVTGRSLLSLQPLGAENARLLAQTISAEDWHTEPPPQWSSYEDIVTQITYRFAWSDAEQKFLAERTFVNQEAVSRYGGEMKKIDIEVRGLALEDVGDGAGDSFGFFLPTSARLFSLLSDPIREWRGSVGTGRSMFVDLGSYVRASSPHLKGYSDDYGVTDGIGFVRAIHQELMSEGCQLELISLGLKPVTWNAAALVTALPSSSSLTISAASFSDDDASFFAVGDIVDYLPAGDEDSAITGLEIASIVGQTITFTSAHSISASGGTLEPTTYANASAAHRADAYLASNTSPAVLGSNTAQVYA